MTPNAAARTSCQRAKPKVSCFYNAPSTAGSDFLCAGWSADTRATFSSSYIELTNEYRIDILICASQRAFQHTQFCETAHRRKAVCESDKQFPVETEVTHVLGSMLEK